MTLVDAARSQEGPRRPPSHPRPAPTPVPVVVPVKGVGTVKVRRLHDVGDVVLDPPSAPPEQPTTERPARPTGLARLACASQWLSLRRLLDD
jgi:hypothetical protein